MEGKHNSDEAKKVAMVHGAVNNCRMDILLDSGASVSMMSLDLARLGVLLGMNFMYSAGIRLCAREGLVRLPDEETVLLAGRTADHMGRGLNLAVTPKTCLYLGPGESAVVRIDYGQSNPQREVVWAGRGDRWVTQIIYAARSWPVAVKVVNISDKTVWIDSRTASLVKTDVHRSDAEFCGTSDSEGTESREAKLIEEVGDSHEDSGSSGEILEDRDPVIVLDEDSDSGGEAVYDAISFDGDDGGVQIPKKPKTPSAPEVSPPDFSGGENAAPAPARGVWCDLYVGDAKPVAQRPRSVAPHLAIKVYALLKKRLETGLIEHSGSPWASPIVIVLKKNGVGIQMCIDYRVVNGFIQLSNYPLPLIDDLLIGFERAMWSMSLDMASGFWAIRMTERAKLISAFVCPFGNFQWEEVDVDQDVLEFLGLDPSRREESGSQDSDLTDTVTVFQRNIPAPASMGPVLGRSSYIDDIAHGAPTWDRLCDDLDALLFRLRYWNISVSLPKSEFGKFSIPYLSHEISAEGIRAVPKIAKGVQDLPFPKTLKGVQSFLGSLNYYHKFIEDLPVVGVILYELSDDQVPSERDLTRAKATLEILKKKIVSTPLLRHPDRSKPFVIIPHANRWAACAVLGQAYDGKIQPVRFTGRVLNDAELRYHIAEKEVIAVLRVLQVFQLLLEGCRLEVYTRLSVFKWILQSKTADGRCVPWGVILSHWDITVRKVQRDEDGLAAIMGAGIPPREHLDKVAESLIAKGCVRKPPVLSVEMLDNTYQGIVLRFEGVAKTSTRCGSCGYTDTLLQLERVSKIAEKLVKPRVVLLDGESPQDSERLGLPQGSVRGVADSQLTPLPHAARGFAVLTRSKTKARTRPSSEVVEDVPLAEEEPRRPMTPLEYQAERWRRIRVHQEQDIYLSEIKSFLKGDIGRFSPRRHRKIFKVANLFALDARDVLYRLAHSTRGRPRDFADGPRLVIPDSLRSNMLHYAHEDFQGGYQGITRTYEKLRSLFYWPNDVCRCNGARIGQCPFQGKGMFSGVNHTGRCGSQELSVTHHDGYCVPGSHRYNIPRRPPPRNMSS
ncbi:unnamed protein product [Phytophthora fragariaefolia]|uniref:Unnamed protein product n=1 Tax=Phytophthora fragariaefolia TaxID=1490495 RepID=A0A9W7D1K4_9STRA|nr:unnamed protein product [Phytophthora fragariaefolia]